MKRIKKRVNKVADSIIKEKEDMGNKLVWAIARNASHRKDIEQRSNKRRALFIILFFVLMLGFIGFYILKGSITGNAVLDGGNILIGDNLNYENLDSSIIIKNEVDNIRFKEDNNAKPKDEVKKESLNIVSKISETKDFVVLSGGAGKKSVKVSKDVYEKINKNEKVRVIVKYGQKSKAGEFGVEKMDIPSRKITAVDVDPTILERIVNSEVEAVYLDSQMKVSLSESIPIIRADLSQKAGLTGKGVGICLLDSGADSSLPYIVSGYDFVNNDNDILDDNGHGINMVSVIHAVAPDAKIIAVKVLDANGVGYSSNVIAGIDYCIQHAIENNIKIISMSFGGGAYSEYCSAEPVASVANDAVAMGIFASASAGNDGHEFITSPACGKNVSAVSSVNKSDSISAFSNMNGMIDLLAHGENIEVNGLTKSGTSISAAHISGAAALLFESEFEITPLDAELRFKTTGNLIRHGGGNYTRIDVYNAIQNNFTGYPADWGINESGEITNVTILYAAIAPTIDFGLLTEANGSYKARNWTIINVTATGAAFANITIYLYNATSSLVNETTSLTSPNFVNITNLLSGIYYFNATAANTANELNYTQTQTITIGTIISDCQTLSAATAYYLIANIMSNTTCINITANNVIFDGNNYIVNYSSNGTAGYGIVINGVNYTLINNTKIYEGRTTSSSNYAVYFDNSNNNTIQNSVVRTSGTSNTYGLYIFNSSSNTILNTNVTAVSSIAIYILGRKTANFNNLTSINISGGSTYGFSVETGVNNTLALSTIRVPYTAMSINAPNTTIISNTIISTGNNFAVDFSTNSEGTKLKLNTVYSSGGNNAGGIRIAASTSGMITIDSNTIFTSGSSAGHGIHSATDLNQIINNTINVTDTGTYGIYLNSAKENNLTGNRVNSTKTSSYVIYGTTASHYNHSVTPDNYAEGKPVNFTFNAANLVFNNVNYSDYGEVIFSNCRNITINSSNFSSDSLNFFLSSNFTIQNSNITTSTGYGVLMDSGSNQNIFEGNNIRITTPNSIGIYSYISANADRISNNTIVTTGANGYGLYLAASTDLNISNNFINGTGSTTSGIYLVTSSNRNIVYNNIINTTTDPIWISSSSNNNVSYNNITIDTNSKNGIYVQGSSSRANRIDNNNIFTGGTSATGINIEGGSYLFSNTINVSKGTTGINIASSAGSNITSNKIYIPTSVSGNGISISGAGTNITGNNLNVISDAIRINTGPGQIISNNVNVSGGSNRGIFINSVNLMQIHNNVVNALSPSANALVFTSSHSNITSNIFSAVNGSSITAIIASGTNNSFVNNTFNSNNSYAFYLQNNNNNFTMFNSILNSSNASSFGFFIENAVTGGFWNLTNVTNGNGQPVNISWQAGANGTLNVHWWLDSLSNHSNSTLLSNVNISGYDNLNRLIFNQKTDSNGRTLTASLLESTRNNTSGLNYTYYSNYTFSANYSTENLSQSWNMTISRDLTFTFGVDAIAPQINFTYPTENNNSYLNRNNIMINVTASDSGSGLKNITIFLYNATGIANSSNSTISSFFMNYTGLPNGNYLFNASAYDINGNINYTETRNVTIDTIVPSVSVTYPQNITYNINVSALNYTVSDANLQACKYSLNGGATNTTIACGANLTDLASSESSNTWIVYANDSAGNSNSSSITFFKDSVYPQINLTYPTENNNSYLNRNNIMINVSVIDINFANITIWVYNTSGQYNSSSSSTNPFFLNLTNMLDGNYLFNATTWDIVNNKNSTETRNVTIDTMAPQINFTYPIETNNTYINRNNIVINITFSDINSIVNATIYLWNTTSLVNVSNSTISSFLVNITNLIDGNYTFNATVRDVAGNANWTEERKVIIDTTAPQINFTNLTQPNATIIATGQNWIFVNVTSSDINFANITYSSYYSNYTQINSTVFNTSINQINFTNLTLQNTYYYNVTIRDLSNNFNSTEERVITLNNPPVTPTPTASASSGGGMSTASKHFNTSLNKECINKPINISISSSEGEKLDYAEISIHRGKNNKKLENRTQYFVIRNEKPSKLKMPMATSFILTEEGEYTLLVKSPLYYDSEYLIDIKSCSGGISIKLKSKNAKEIKTEVVTEQYLQNPILELSPKNEMLSSIDNGESYGYRNIIFSIIFVVFVIGLCIFFLLYKLRNKKHKVKFKR